MDKVQLNLISKELSVVVGAALQSITRSADSLCLNLGEMVSCNGAIRNEAGKLVPSQVQRSQYALVISCGYRISCGNEIILAKGDLYQPAQSILSQWATDGVDDIPDDFNCEDIGCNRLDERIYNLLSICSQVRVKTIKINPLGDLKIEFSNGFVLSAAVDVSGSEECWRFYARNSDCHFVVNGTGLELDDDQTC